jgi:hypothetical protein
MVTREPFSSLAVGAARRATGVPSRICLVTLVLYLAVIVSAGYDRGQSDPRKPIVDSMKTAEEAFDGLDPNCPEDIRNKQAIVEVLYYSTDHKIHQGQVVIDRELQADIRSVFRFALKTRFPIQSAIPISDPRFRKNGRWDDELSMEANNTSAFNYRQSTGSTQLSKHAYGRAIDINPFLNPYVKDKTVLPHNAKYDPGVPGTFASSSSIVHFFKRLGWKWGGDWETLKDYQHFEKPQ